MFNPFSRSFLPGFRVEPDGAPGFNLDDNGLPRRTNASFDGTFPDSATQQYSDAAQTQSPPSISFRLPGAEGWVLSTPVPGFRVSPQDEVPGFNVGPQNDVPGFNVDGNGVQQQQTTFGRPPGSVTPQEPNTAQTATPPAYDEELAPPVAPPLPEWSYQLGTMLPPLPPAFDPRTEPRVEINSLPSIGPAMVPGAVSWLPSIAPQPPPGIDIPSRVATTQNANFQPVALQAMRNAWLPPLTVGQPYAQANGGELQEPRRFPMARQAVGVPPTQPARPLADSNFILANAGDAGVQQTPQQEPLPQTKPAQQQIPSSPSGTGRADTSPALRIQEKPGTEMTVTERQPEQSLSRSIEECRRAAADLTQELAHAATRFGKRFYEDFILRAGSDLAQLAERFANEPVETADSILASFPQT